MGNFSKTLTKITSKEREERRLWNPIALREAVINAMVHNDYTSEVPPKFEFFTDRIEITSYGSLPQGMTERAFFEGYSVPRSKELMRIFRDVDLVEHLGSGVPRILRSYGRECFKFTENFVRMIFPSSKPDAHVMPPNKDTAQVAQILDTEKTRQEELLGLAENFVALMLRESFDYTTWRKDNVEGKCPAYRHKHKNDPKFKIEEFVFEMTGVDLMAIDGVGFTTILTMLSETGFDLKEKFTSAKHFASWLGYCPNNKVSGGKILSSLTGMQTNPLSQAIRNAANSAGNSQSQLGNFFRRISHRKGRMVAIIATARKIAVIIYNMLTKKEGFHYEGAEVNEEKIKERRIKKALKTLEQYNISTDQLKVGFV